MPEEKASFGKGASASKNGQDTNNGVTNKDAVKCSEVSTESDDSSGFIVDAASVNEDRVAEVMAAIRKNHYSPATVMDSTGFEGDCRDMFKKDYDVVMVPNKGGSVSYNYPLELIIPVGPNSKDERKASEFDKRRYILLANISCIVRSRSRFIAPVIYLDNKFICRSGTVGNTVTAVYETIRRQEAPGPEYIAEGVFEMGQRILKSIIDGIFTYNILEATRILWKKNEMRDRLNQDAELLKLLKVEHICDLMVETEKLALKSMLSVSSSEKVNMDVYNGFKIEQMPFPGCEFFKDYHDASRNPKGLVFNWAAPDVNVEFRLSEDPKLSFPEMDFNKLKEWDLIELTKAYMKVLLTFVARDAGSLLVHCISGWDRTPLFISLIRVSLWADGAVHASLNVVEMAFLTLAYDWYLFGHAFPVRYSKHEEVMHFCFNFMQYMADDEFSVTRIFHELSSEQKKYRKFPDFKPGERRGKISEISSFLLRMYDQEILMKPAIEVSNTMIEDASEITSVLDKDKAEEIFACCNKSKEVKTPITQ